MSVYEHILTGVIGQHWDIFSPCPCMYTYHKAPVPHSIKRCVHGIFVAHHCTNLFIHYNYVLCNVHHHKSDK